MVPEHASALRGESASGAPIEDPHTSLATIRGAVSGG